MKSTITAPLALLAAAAQNVAGSALLPRSNTTDLSPAGASGDVQTETLSVQVDCNELINQVLAGVSAYPQFATQAVAVGRKVGLPAGTAFAVCKMFKTDAVDCTYAAGSVAGAISLAISNGYMDLIDEGSDPATPSKRALLASSLQEKLEARGAQFEAISVDLEARSASGNGTGHGHGHGHGHHGQRAQILGARFPGLHSTATTDFAIQRLPRGNGGSIRASSSASGGLGRRDGFGFKVDYEVFNRIGTAPSEGAFDEMARVIADDWSSRVTAEQDIGDYIAVADFGYMGYIQFRVSPEESSFGTDFENVDTCEA